VASLSQKPVSAPCVGSVVEKTATAIQASESFRLRGSVVFIESINLINPITKISKITPSVSH